MMLCILDIIQKLNHKHNVIRVLHVIKSQLRRYKVIKCPEFDSIGIILTMLFLKLRNIIIYRKKM